ncbi:hypothetical protein JYP52_01315 [Nitratireductor aquibiodomus]|uniref:hypothetical protein n=1 Tax=Nitratireductor aquibiodomus TaxID=204799 RepID=UPI0019D3923F|nr:hypothetical protein [Nitratireductor aquibiodomus]MBN7759761.1 hypothetical protein [Nitratireductor aquibiodomus]
MIETVFSTYRQHIEAMPINRLVPSAPRTWSLSPIRDLIDLSSYNGTLMEAIPAHRRLPDVNPRLIDQLQLIWVWNRAPLFPIRTYRESRLKALNLLESNVGKPLKAQTPYYPINYMVMFDGSPQEACP